MQSYSFKLEQLKQKLSSVKRSAWKPTGQEGDGECLEHKDQVTLIWQCC